MTRNSTSPHSKRWLSTREAAEYLGCSSSFLEKDRLSRLHGIPFSKLGRHVRYAVDDLDAHLQRNKENTVN